MHSDTSCTLGVYIRPQLLICRGTKTPDEYKAMVPLPLRTCYAERWVKGPQHLVILVDFDTSTTDPGSFPCISYNDPENPTIDQEEGQ